MKHLDEYRDRKVCENLAQEICRTTTRPRTIMEVCGGQTHGLLRHGIDRQLSGAVRLIHGPGCPVCVTPVEEIDRAIALAADPQVILTSFGDMLRVPGSRESLLQARLRGGDVRFVYSPLDAVQLAARHPERQVVFFAVGFETTMPATALAVRHAAERGLKNFSMLAAHVRVLPAMEAIMRDEACQVEGFLAAGHVCTVSGFEQYFQFAERYGVPVVVTGFEPADLLSGILACARRIESGQAGVENCYSRAARADGNRHAVEMMEDVYEVCDRPWRGVGVIPGGGARLRGPWRRFDAALRFPAATSVPAECSPCRAGEVLTGRIRPHECEYFGRQCTPENPLGAPMVSSEGACAAYYLYARDGRPNMSACPIGPGTPY
jgi:hydrogenase expression/formation protein HypD